MIRIGLGNHSVGLGDCLVQLPLARALGTQCIFEMPYSCARFSPLFTGLCETHLTDLPAETRNAGTGHFAQRKLRAYGFSSDSYLPQMNLQMLGLSGRERSIDIALVTDCAKHWRHVRGTSHLPWSDLLRQLDGLEIVQYGTTDHALVPGAQDGRGSSIPSLMEFYSSTRLYVGADTGDLHLALASGADAIVVVPPDCPEYRYEHWHYNFPNRVSYVTLDRFPEVRGIITQKLLAVGAI